MDAARLAARYRELQDYVGWTDDDARRVAGLAPTLGHVLPGLVDDFYAVLERHPNARRVITGGPEQIERLKRMLLDWLGELLSGVYDGAYVERRWRVGWRHVEIGLDQVYTNVALSRLRTGLLREIHGRWAGDLDEQRAAVRSLNKLLDLDLAIIEDAYQAEYARRLQQNERLATLGQVAGGVAHELRNPLNVVKTSVYYLTHARNATPEKRAEHLARIERHVGVADSVITALSRFAKAPAPVLAATAVDRALAEALDLNPPGPGVEVALDIPAGLPRVLADPDQLQIVLGNLLRNAWDAMPEGGRLAVEARHQGDQVAVDVVDTGTGIRPEDLARIAEPLFSTKARGLGLGLSIVRSILDGSRGQLEVRSTLGSGSTFTVRLAAAPDPGGLEP